MCSASSSGISISNSSSSRITSSTRSSESAPRSSVKDACSVTSSGLTSSSSAMTLLTRSNVDIVSSLSGLQVFGSLRSWCSGVSSLRSHEQPAVYRDDLARDVSRVVRAQKEDNARHVLGGAETGQWHLLFHLFPQLFRQCVGHHRLN